MFIFQSLSSTPTGSQKCAFYTSICKEYSKCDQFTTFLNVVSSIMHKTKIVIEKMFEAVVLCYNAVVKAINHLRPCRMVWLKTFLA